MKTRLLRKLKKLISDIYNDAVITPMVFNPQYMKHEPLLLKGFDGKFSECKYIVNANKPMAPQIWRKLDLQSSWFMKYWKNSRWSGLLKLTAAAENISEQKAAAATLEIAREHWKKCDKNRQSRLREISWRNIQIGL